MDVLFFCKFLINFSKFFKSIWWIQFCLMFFLSNRNFGDAIAVQGFSWIHVWSFVQCSPYPNQNSGATPTPVHLISIHISTVICTLSQKNKTLLVSKPSKLDCRPRLSGSRIGYRLKPPPILVWHPNSGSSDTCGRGRALRCSCTGEEMRTRRVAAVADGARWVRLGISLRAPLGNQQGILLNFQNLKLNWFFIF